MTAENKPYITDTGPWCRPYCKVTLLLKQISSDWIYYGYSLSVTDDAKGGKLFETEIICTTHYLKHAEHSPAKYHI